MLKRILALLLIIVINLSIPINKTFGATPTKIIVGVEETKGFFERTTNGEFTGILYEYLMEIAKYTGWNYQFMITDSYSLQQMLERNEIDILAGVPASSELENKFLFPKLNTGYMNSTLNVNLQNSDINQFDYTTLDNAIIGVCHISEAELRSLYAFLEKNQLHCNIAYYDSDEELAKALNLKNIDAAVGTDANVYPNQRIVTNFYEQPLYCVTSIGNEKLFYNLNNALNHIKEVYPDYDRILYDKYMQCQQDSQVTLSLQERMYIKDSDVINVAIYPLIEPMQYFDENGEFCGIVADVYSLIEEKTGLRFRFVPFASYNQYIAALQSGKYQMASTKNRFVNTELGSLMEASWPYLNTSNVLVKNTSVQPSADKKFVLATVFGSRHSKMYQHMENLYFDSFERCLSAVNNNVADYTIESAILVEYLTQKNTYHSISVTALSQSEFDLCLGFIKPIDDKLLTIVNKTLYSIPQSQFKEIMLSHTLAVKKDFSLIDYFYYNPTSSIFILCLIFGSLAYMLLLIVKIRLKHAKRLYRLSNIDDITGASSSVRFKADVKQSLKLDKNYAMIAMDIKKFTIINDMFGHTQGDFVLIQTAHIVQKHLSDGEYFARMNADIFYIFTIYQSNEKIMEMMESIAGDVLNLIDNYFIEIAYGVYVIPEDINDVDIICDRTNLANRSVKSRNDQNYCFFNDEMRNSILIEQEISNLAEDALANHEFRLYLQPQYKFKNGQLIGAEALVRWHSSVKGIIYPDDFIPLFEKNGFIKKLDIYMFTEVCRLLKHFSTEYSEVPLPVISVNFSRLHFNNLHLADDLLKIAKSYGINPNVLDIELTESAIYYNEEHFITIINSLKKAGFRLSLDDFGTGYSSLNTLKDLPVDTIKLDKGFLDKSTDTPRGKNIIKCLIILAKAVELSTVVEGVETKEQADFLTEIGCDVAQGYFYAKPMPVWDFWSSWCMSHKMQNTPKWHKMDYYLGNNLK